MFLGVPYRYLVGLVAIHLLFAIAALFFKQYYLIDSYGYLLQADNLVNHGAWYAEDWNMPVLVDYFSIRPPLYAAFIAICKWIVPSVWSVLFCQVCLSMLNAILAYRFVLKLGVSFQRMPLVGLLLLVLYPAQLLHSLFVMSEICFQTLLLLLFFATTSFLNQPSIKHSSAMCLLLALILWIKPVGLVLVGVCLVLLVVKWVKQSFSIFLFAPVVLVVFSYHLINNHHQQVTGYYHYTSIGSINHLKYNAKYTLIHAKGEQYADSVIAAVMNKANSKWIYKERLQWMNEQANEIIRNHPIDFAIVYAKGCISFLIDPGRFDLHTFTNTQSVGLGLMHEMQTKGFSALLAYLKQAPLYVMIWLIVAFITNSITCLLMLRLLPQLFTKPFTENGWLWASVLFVGAIMLATGPVGVSRYKVPVYLIIWMMAIYSYAQLSLTKKQHHEV